MTRSIDFFNRLQKEGDFMFDYCPAFLIAQRGHHLLEAQRNNC